MIGVMTVQSTWGRTSTTALAPLGLVKPPGTHGMVHEEPRAISE